jgi:hypothetical protein
VQVARHQWFTPVILATWEAKIGRISIWVQPQQIVRETPSTKITRAKWIGGVTQVWSTCFKLWAVRIRKAFLGEALPAMAHLHVHMQESHGGILMIAHDVHLTFMITVPAQWIV